MKTQDDLLEHVGSFGRFQKRSLLMIYLMTLTCPSIVMMCSIFITYTPPHRCYIPDLDDHNASTSSYSKLPKIPDNYKELNFSNSTDNEVFHLARHIPVEIGSEGNPIWSQCYRYQSDIHHDSFPPSNRTKIPCDMGWKYYVTPGLSSAVTQFDLVCGQAWKGPLASSLLVIGFFVGNLIGGYVSDRWGRRFSFIISSSLSIVCCAVMAALPVWEMSYPIWFVWGNLFASRVTSGVVMINEITTQKYRYLACFFNMMCAASSYMLTSMINYFIVNWHYYLIVQAALQTFALIPIILFLRETLKWLLQNKKHEKATQLLSEIARINKRKPFEDTTLLPNEQNDQTKETTEKKEKLQRLSYINLFKISFLRKRIFILAIAWIAVTTNYYGLSINTNGLGGDRYIACFISGAVEIPGNLFCYFGLKRFGGRRAFMMMIGTSGLFLLATPLMFFWSQTAVIVSNMVGKLFASGAFAGLYIFLGDFFPTLLRIQAYGVSSGPSRFTSMIIPYLVYLGDQYFKAIPYLVMGGTAILSAIGMCFLPETRNRPLPDTIEDAREQEKDIPETFQCFSDTEKGAERGDINDNYVSDKKGKKKEVLKSLK